MIPVLGLVAGIIIGIAVNFHVTPDISPYVAIALLAALDSVFGGIAASMQKTFNMTVFITGFFGNALLAVGIIYIGNRLDVDLHLAAVVVFGTRLFNNFAIIRRLIIANFMNRQPKKVQS